MNAIAHTATLLAEHHWRHDAWFPWFPLIPLLLVTLWIALIVRFRRCWDHCGTRGGEQVLAERFARGEIDEREYRERRATLRGR
jgi:putative membrane protein